MYSNIHQGGIRMLWCCPPLQAKYWQNFLYVPANLWTFRSNVKCCLFLNPSLLVCKWSELLIWGIYSLRLTVVSVNRWKWRGAVRPLYELVDSASVYINAVRKFYPFFGCDCMLWLCRRCGNGISPPDKIEVWSPKVCLWFMSRGNTTHMFISVRHSWRNRRFLADGRKKVCPFNVQKRGKGCRRKLSRIMFEWDESEMTRELKESHILNQSTKPQKKQGKTQKQKQKNAQK